MNRAAHLAAYRRRLGVPVEPPTADLASLAEMQLAHLVTVPFENIDVYQRRWLHSDPARSVERIATSGRGGWCFVLNGAFAELLTASGFTVRTVACRVYDEDGTWGPRFDHCANVVQLHGQCWFVDVGFGDACIVPLPFEPGEHHGVPYPVRIERTGTEMVISDRHDGAWTPRLAVEPGPVAMAAFDARSTALQTEPGFWIDKPFATRALDASGSRVTLRSAVLRRREGAGEYVDRVVRPGEWPALLRTEFGIDEPTIRPPSAE
jgi:N-hydroxyarylamine O-acetyltransferase